MPKGESLTCWALLTLIWSLGSKRNFFWKGFSCKWIWCKKDHPLCKSLTHRSASNCLLPWLSHFYNLFQILESGYKSNLQHLGEISFISRLISPVGPRLEHSKPTLNLRNKSRCLKIAPLLHHLFFRRRRHVVVASGAPARGARPDRRSPVPEAL